MKRIKPLRFKPIRLRFNLDTDNDRVTDWKDCRPFNPFKQHVGPSEYVTELDEDVTGLLKKVQKEAYKRYKNKNEAKKTAMMVASRAMEQKTQSPRFDFGPKIIEEFPHTYEVKFYIPSFLNITESKKDKTYLDIWDRDADVHFFVDVSGYIHEHSSFKYSGPFTKDVYHVRGKRLFAPKLILVITSLDKEKFGRDFDSFFEAVMEKQVLI